MNSLKNKVQLIGNLGDDPKLQDLESGKQVTRFSLATNESYKNGEGELVTDTQWHTIIAWNKTAELICKFLKKGSEVAIEGSLSYKSFEDKNNQKKYVTEINCHEFLVLKNK